VKRLLAVVVGLALALIGTVAVAAWLSTGSANATVTATTVNQANAPTATHGAGTVDLSWTASTLANNAPVGGYRVVRHDGATTTTVCTVAALACTDNTPVGTAVTYGVIATIGTNWKGPESAPTTFTYDIVAPNTTASISPLPNGAGWNKASITLTLTATDPAIGSGVDHVTYAVDGGSAVTVASSSTSFAVNGTGTHTVTYFAVDQVGNTEATKTTTVRIDPDAPLITNLQPASGSSGNWSAINCGNANRVCADVSDATSGVATGTVTFSLTGTSGANSGKCWNGSSFVVSPCAQQPMSVISGNTYGSTTALTAAAVTSGSYTMVVSATDVAGNTNTATSTFTVKADQTISFTSTAPANATVGGATYAVAATATSGLAVTFTSATTSVCTVTGSTVSFVGAGTCTINADQSGNGTFNAAPQVQQSFAVKATQTLTFNALGGRTFGDAPFTVSATASSGLSVAFSSATTAVCTVSGGTVTILTAGTCTINADQAGDTTYNAAPQVQQSFTVAKANQTVSFTSTAPSTRAAGTTYSPTATASSGLTVTITVSGACSIASGTVTFGPSAGTCTINADQGGDGNYNPASQAHQSVTVTASDTTAPTVTFTYPTIGSTINNGTWTNNGCTLVGKPAGLCGTASDNVGVVGSALYELRNTSATPNTCWNGSAFAAAACGSYQTAGGTGASWQISLAFGSLPTATFELRVKVSDAAGNSNRLAATPGGAADVTFTR